MEKLREQPKDHSVELVAGSEVAAEVDVEVAEKHFEVAEDSALALLMQHLSPRFAVHCVLQSQDVLENPSVTKTPREAPSLTSVMKIGPEVAEMDQMAVSPGK